jgi:phenylalanyl-tRNA synthetase alpha chain
MVIDRVVNAPFFQSFDHIQTPEVVNERETFDIFNFPENHVARRPSDSYFLHKSEIKKESLLLRPHTSVMRYYYLIEGKAKEVLEKTGEVKALSRGKVYRVDELDKSHHECFHQIDGLRITAKDKEIINQDTLKEVLGNTIKALFGEQVQYRFNVDQFPYTTDSLEVEVEYEGNWIEVTGAGVVHPTVLESL